MRDFLNSFASWEGGNLFRKSGEGCRRFPIHWQCESVTTDSCSGAENFSSCDRGRPGLSARRFEKAALLVLEAGVVERKLVETLSGIWNRISRGLEKPGGVYFWTATDSMPEGKW